MSMKIAVETRMPATLRMPPVNRGAELGLIGSCTLDRDQIDAAVEIGVVPEDFFDARCADAWRCLVGMRGDAQAIDYTTIYERMKSLRVRWADDGGVPSEEFQEFCTDAAEAAPVAYHAPAYAAIVREKAAKRKLILACSEIMDECYAENGATDDILAAAEERVMAVGDSLIVKGPVGIREALNQVHDRINSRLAGRVQGVPTGFEALDAMIDGLGDGKLVVLAARPSIGKSAMALNVATHVACGSDRRRPAPVLYVSLEMSAADLAERFLAAKAEVEASRIKRAVGLDGGCNERIYRVMESLDGVALEIDDEPNRTVSQIAAIARRMKARKGLGLLVVDYLQLVEEKAERGESRENVVSRMSRRFKKLAGTLDVPVLLVAQLNRNPESREDHRPRLSDLRESGAVEQDANIVLLLHRPDFYKPDDHPGMAEVIVAKNREGQTGSVWLNYHKQLVRFDDLEERGPRYF